MLMQNRRAVSPVIATLLLIAIAVAAGIILYVFVGGLTSSLSNVKGTVTQPLQVTVTSVTKLSPGTAVSWQVTFQVVNPNGATVTLTNAIITDNTGAQVTAAVFGITSVTAGTATCSASASSPSVGGQTNTGVAICFNVSPSASASVSGLISGNTYRLVVTGTDSAGNQYSSNPAVFTLR